MTVLLYILKLHLISVYFFIKLFHRQKKQVCFLSRQTNTLSLNYKLIIKELDKYNIPYKYICKKVDSKVNDSIRTHGKYSNNFNFIINIFKNLKSNFSYYLSLYSQMRLIASSKVIIVDGYCLPVSLLKHKKGTKVIQIWHALGAIKKFGHQVIGNKEGVSYKVAKILKMHNNYDYILSGTEAMNSYFSEAFNTSIDKILTIGTPTIDYLLKKNIDIINQIYSKYPELKNKKNVLYSPTFRNDNRSGLKELVENFDFNKFNLIITFHPKVKEDIDDDRIIKINSKEFLTYDILKISDYVITDYSSLLIDALVINRKVLLYVFDYENYKENNGLNIDLVKEFPNITRRDGKGINELLLSKYNDKDYKKLQKNYKPKVKNCSKRIVSLIKECMK